MAILFNNPLFVWVFGLLLCVPGLTYTDVALKVKDPENYLKKQGPLVILGNTPLEKADIVFLPEIHDDPHSLLTQLLLLAQEKDKGQTFMVLDESLASMKKSVWDVFSQKTLEILAAHEQRNKGEAYAPSKFEGVLKRLAQKYRSTSGQLGLDKGTGLWTLSSYQSVATPFYGWDYGLKGKTLVDRNQQMVESLKEARKKGSRILVMAGARHIPELEFLTSQELFCEHQQFKNIKDYFAALEAKFGQAPSLSFGIGATLPIYQYIRNERYAVVFSKDIYNELDRVIAQFKNKQPEASCFKLH